MKYKIQPRKHKGAEMKGNKHMAPLCIAELQVATPQFTHSKRGRNTAMPSDWTIGWSNTVETPTERC